MSRDFRLWDFSWIMLLHPQIIPSYPDRFENSRRDSQLKVHHRRRRQRWQIKKLSIRKFKNFFWTLSCKVTYTVEEFFLQVNFQMYFFGSLIVFPLFTTGVINTWGKFATNVETGGKLPSVSLIPVSFAAGINETSGIGGKFAAGVVDTGGALGLANIYMKFWKDSLWP